MVVDIPLKLLGSTYSDGVLLNGIKELLPMYVGWHILTDLISFGAVISQLFGASNFYLAGFMFKIYDLRYYLSFIRVELALH